MQYHEALNYLLNLRRYATRPGTDATTALLSHLDGPQEGFPTIQVAGSNGKGSTARMIESVLSEAGMDVGLYTSPHLDDPRDRIRVNGHKIRKEAVVTFVKQTEEYLTDHAADGTSPTFFETLTALALWEFGRQDVDVAVLEVGIGGPLDATSAVDPVASAVTTVAREHTDILGEEIETIARDMAGIEPDESPLVTGATGSALDALAEETSELLTVARPDSTDSSPAVSVQYHGRAGIEGEITVETPARTIETSVPLLGAHQARNAGVAVGVLSVLPAQTALDTISTETIERGLRNAHWPGRFEIMNQDPLVVLDGGHNPDGCEAAAETLEEFEYDTLHAVVGAMADKDLRGIANALPAVDEVVACEPDHSRAEDARAIQRVFEQETTATVRSRTDVRQAVADRLDAAAETDCVLVTGSLYTVGEARSHWTQSIVPKAVDTTDGAEAMLPSSDSVRESAERAVHRVVKTRLKPRRAQALKTTMLGVGGECVVAGIDPESTEKRTVVLMGTLQQFGELADRLTGRRDGLALFADDLREQLERDGSGGSYPWEDGTAVMGILNVTPDSFHDGGEYDELDDAIARARELVEQGVDIIDVGGESTRPGADPVPATDEIARVQPVIEALSDLDVLVSIDTRKAQVARAALDAGADILNDVSGLEDPAMRLVAADYDVPVVVMHSIDAPVDPGNDPEYDDVVEDVIEELTERVLLAEKAGLDRSQIIVDPGLGFGKTAPESFELLGRIGEFDGLSCPVLVGHSHKSMFGQVDRESGQRYEPTIAATALATERGADIVRVHDVAANVAAVDVVEAASNNSPE